MLSIASKAIASVHKLFSPTKEFSAGSQNMETYASRLNSFESTRSTGKTRTSNAKSSKLGKWPHKSPSPAELARAGFFFEPSASSPDNVTCAICLKSLDGWEPNDDPIKEHLAYSPDCGIAVHANLEQELEAGNRNFEHPLSERMVLARKMTFGDIWPHERKRGWSCKVQKMVEAGWYYCPTSESDDFVKCAYCSLGLDGWEPKDKPFEEHRRRSADCLFFAFGQPTKAKATKPKKARNSKASRLSTQSTQSTFTEDVAMIDSEFVVDETNILGDELDLPMATTAPAKEKRNGRTKKGASKAKTGKFQDQALGNTQSDELEAKIDEDTKPRKKGGKRTSDAMSREDVDAGPAAKRRGTRANSTTIKPELSVAGKQEEDIHMTYANEPHAPTSADAKGKKRASKARKASNLSTASKASLRSRAPTDGEIDAVLEAELNQPLSEEEFDANSSSKISRNQRGLQKPPASIARTGRNRNYNTTTETSGLKGEMDNYLGSPQQSREGEEVTDDDTASLEQHVRPIVNPKSMRGHNVRVTNAEDTQEATIARNPSITSQPEQEPVEIDSRPTRGKLRQASKQVSKQKGSGAQLSSSAPRIFEDSSVLTASTISAADEAGESSDGSHAIVKRGRVASRTASGTVRKRGRKPKTISTRVNTEVNKQTASEVNDSSTKILPEAAPTESVLPVAQTINPDNKKPKATRGRPKAKKASSLGLLDDQAVVSESTDPQEEQIQSPVSQYREEFELKKPVQTPNSKKLNTTKDTDNHCIVTSHDKQNEPTLAQHVLSPAPSPQSSDAENQPPSSRPSALRPPLEQISPSKTNTTRVQIAASTPTRGIKHGCDGLETSFQWTATEIEEILVESSVPGDRVEIVSLHSSVADEGQSMTVEEWILHQAKVGEEKIKNKCEMIVGKFESEGVRALKALEGIVTYDD